MNNLNWAIFVQQASNWFDQHLGDGGPVYMETRHPGHFLVEPWNSLSSLLILIPAFYWLYKIRKSIPHFRFMLYAIILVVLGGLGSTLFHGLRISPFFLFMDFVPSAILSLSVSIYLWLKILKKWWYVLLIVIPVFLMRFLFWGRLPAHLSINLSYFITGFFAGLPLVIIMFRTKFRMWGTVAGAIIPFIIALIFRETDTIHFSFLPMGTHFLWHTFSAVGTFFVLRYLYYIRELHLNEG
jgi:hypothetical protein